MLVSLPGEQLLRVHGAYVEDAECEAVAEHWTSQSSPTYIAAVVGDTAAAEADPAPEYEQAKRLVLTSLNPSTSWLQRQLRIGYNMAAQHIGRMENDGLVAPPDGIGRRNVIVPSQSELSAEPRRGWWQRTFGR